MERSEGGGRGPFSESRSNQQTASATVNGQICASLPLCVYAGVRVGRNGMYTGKGCEGVWLLEMKEGTEFKLLACLVLRRRSPFDPPPYVPISHFPSFVKALIVCARCRFDIKRFGNKIR